MFDNSKVGEDEEMAEVPKKEVIEVEDTPQPKKDKKSNKEKEGKSDTVMHDVLNSWGAEGILNIISRYLPILFVYTYHYCR